MEVGNPEILFIPLLERVAEELYGLGADVGESPGLDISPPRDGRRGFNQPAKILLALASPAPFPQHQDDQDGFENAQCQYQDDFPFVALPKRRLPKLNDAAGRQAMFVDPPPPQLTPVVDRR